MAFSNANAIYPLIFLIGLAIVALSVFLRRRHGFKSLRGKSELPRQLYFDDGSTECVQTVYDESRHDDAKGRVPGIKQTFEEVNSSSVDYDSPYYAGNTLRLEVTKQSDSQQKLPLFVHVIILQIIEPITMSVVMKVLLRDALGREKIAILKLYDRRYALGVRDEWYGKIPPWGPTREVEYRKAVECGQLEAYLQWLESEEPDDDGEDSEDRIGNMIAQDEGDIYQRSLLSYTQESAIYERLEHLQGQDIPQLFATVRLDRKTISPPISTDDKTATYLDVPGLLLEYVEGFFLYDLAEHTPKELWQPVVDDAIRIVNRITDHDVLNEDVKTRNTLVRKADNSTGYKVVMIDFGHARLRGPDEPDLDWRVAKHSADEEGAIGGPMSRQLNKISPGVIVYDDHANTPRWLGVQTFENPPAYKEWCLNNPNEAEGVGYHEDALASLNAEGAIIWEGWPSRNREPPPRN